MQSAAPPISELKSVIARHWGIHSLRPLQEPAMTAVLEGKDSLVVLPTGGGKSLCYQAPAVFRGDTTVVISPLISLMKDQVDSLRSAGINAVQLDSSLTAQERNAYEKELRQGNVRLLFIAPERLVQTEFCELLRAINVRTFAIDEAHCISHWGHDFRPEYRRLAMLRRMFPEASLHAYTATATEQVRSDIMQQLSLRDPAVLIGNFNRANLTYRIFPRRGNGLKQVMDVVGRHHGEGGIIYCLRRSDVDELTTALAQTGIKAMPYHAGLTAEQRSTTQNAFSQEKCDVVVATVAFGMGIDRSNVRYVLHTAMPKSVEHYQQETGRAGRDGLEAECVLLHSGADFFTWKSIIEKAAYESEADSSFVENSMKHLSDISRYCRGAACRHQLLVQYFGQPYEHENCNACDICLEETSEVPGAMQLAQKILSCVARVKERYGVGYIVSVLRGENTQNIRTREHDKLSTYGLLRGVAADDIRDWIYQLISQDALTLEDCETEFGRPLPIVRLTGGSWQVMRNQRTVRLLQSQTAKNESRKSKPSAGETWDGVDRDLFEACRALRRQLADERRVPPYIIFNDATLRELSRARPSSLLEMRKISGIGDTKLGDFGAQFLELITAHSSVTP